MADTVCIVSAAFDRTLFWQHDQSDRYLAVRLNAKRAAAKTIPERAHLNIALAIDASGSMGGGKLEAAKQAALDLVERMTVADRLSLVSLASDVQVHIDAVPVYANNRAAIARQIDQLTTRGMTCLSGYLPQRGSRRGTGVRFRREWYAAGRRRRVDGGFAGCGLASSG
jgi:Ca-activated chloride channel family protein